MKQNLLNFKLSTLEKESWTSEAMVQHSLILNICIVWPAGRTNVIWIKCKHTITYFSSHPHSKQYNTYAKSMPAVGGQTLNDWTRTLRQQSELILLLCFAFEQFFLLRSTRKQDLPFCGAAAWGTLFITSDSGHIISKLLLFSIYWDGHLWREEIPSPKAHSVSVFLLRLLTRGNYNQFSQCLLCYWSPSTGKWSESKTVDSIQAAIWEQTVFRDYFHSKVNLALSWYFFYTIFIQKSLIQVCSVFKDEFLQYLLTFR